MRTLQILGMGRIGMVDRRQHAPLRQQRGAVHHLAQPARGHQARKALMVLQRRDGKVIDAGRIVDLAGDAALDGSGPTHEVTLTGGDHGPQRPSRSMARTRAS